MLYEKSYKIISVVELVSCGPDHSKKSYFMDVSYYNWTFLCIFMLNILIFIYFIRG